MSRFARKGKVLFFEEPVYHDAPTSFTEHRCERSGVYVLTPHLLTGTEPQSANWQLGKLLRTALNRHGMNNYVAWYYTPMALHFAGPILEPALTVYDCMDELSGFDGAPPELKASEQELFRRADLVFTGGASLFNAKRTQYPAVYLFPSSVDVEHFKKARSTRELPVDQATIPEPRIGFAGVIDERMDIKLLKEVATKRPDWHFVLLGPVAKLDERVLPREANIHYLGMKNYDDLPRYFAGWKVGMLPFALNAATKYISPTKTPEYLAAGLRVVSTPITDVVRPYGENGLAAIAGTPEQFTGAIEHLLGEGSSTEFRGQADAFLRQTSWDDTWGRMSILIEDRMTRQVHQAVLASTGD